MTSYIGQHISSLPTPALVVDKEKFKKNCQKMLRLADINNISLRSQTKTHKTVEGAILQTGGTKRKIVTSTLVECEMYADAGFEDILYGFPYIHKHQERVWKLTERLQEFHLMVASLESAQELASNVPPKGKKWSVFLKVDCGNARAGIWAEDDVALDIVAYINAEERLSFAGIYAHCGNSYGASTVKEIHPGAYVFYDAQQIGLGSCLHEEVAAKIAHSRMISPIVDCPKLMLSNMTQEIGFVEPVNEFDVPDYDRHPVGSLLQIIPYHACATAACHKVYYVHDSEGIILEEWRPCSGW